ncbi:MAG TPA: lysine exporter LysO family protein [Paludibacter sp.]|nr:lysine exporter LysO family protein [Paludibacter sp.]
MKGSLVILSFFAAGLLLGVSRCFPLEFSGSGISFYVLCLLMFSVGVGMGNNPDTFRRFRHMNPRIVFLPLMTLAGTWLGVMVVSLFLKSRSLAECLAVGSGFGYYSLSSILITQYKGVELGTIALLSNIMREVLTLLLAPWLVKYFGKLSVISAGGATTMDTTFPVVVRNSGSSYVVASIYHGFVVDFSVPFLVTFFCSL